MKKMIKVSILIVMMVYPSMISAQIFGVRGGFNLSNVLIKYDGETWSDDFKMKPGFHIGPTMEIPLSEVVSIDGALLYTTKGTKMKESETYQNTTYEYKSTTTLNYLELPVNLKVKFDIGSIIGFGAIGPYFGYALSGKSKYEESINGNSSSETEDIDFDEDGDLKRFDFGMGFTGGIEVGKMQFGINYGLGLSNISQYSDDDETVKNRNLSFFGAYRFLDN